MQDPGSLENLRDIAVPAPVSWWPLAVGWWFVIAITLILVFALLYRAWQQWKRDAYRRAALVELESASDDSSVVAILKRTAICADKTNSPEPSPLKALTGEQWCCWLAEHSKASLSTVVRDRLTVGVYRDGRQLTPELVQFAKEWIMTHETGDRSSEPMEGHKLA